MSTAFRNLTWTAEDTQRAILSSVAPGAVGLCFYVSYFRNENIIEWWNSIRKPNWAPEPLSLYSTVDALTLAPIGYASYMVYKYGDGFDNKETALALSLYGINLASLFVSGPIIATKNFDAIFYSSVVTHLTAAGAAYTFYKIDHRAGLLMVPYALWMGFYVLWSYSTRKLNSGGGVDLSH